MAELLTTEAALSFATLTLMEIVLGIDNIVFISILCDKLPENTQASARRLGLSLALIMRLGLLFSITWLMGLTEPLFAVWAHPVSGRDLVLLAGGLFLIGKATYEIYDKLEIQHEGEETSGAAGGAARFGWTLVQIMVLDLVFSLDSVITAVGMARHLAIMVAAMVVAVGVMLVFAGVISDFVNKYPSMKILALSFLLLIGVMLLLDGMGQHVSKGYIYAAMAFSLMVELLNMRFRRTHAPIRLHESHLRPRANGHPGSRGSGAPAANAA